MRRNFFFCLFYYESKGHLEIHFLKLALSIIYKKQGNGQVFWYSLKQVNVQIMLQWMTAKSLCVQKKPATGYRLSVGSGKRREIESRTNKKKKRKKKERKKEIMGQKVMRMEDSSNHVSVLCKEFNNRCPCCLQWFHDISALDKKTCLVVIFAHHFPSS